MGYFVDADEVYMYVGGVFQMADATAGVGDKLRAADLVLRLEYSNPDAIITVVMRQPAAEVITGVCDVKPDVVMRLSSDNADKFWRGEFNIAVGLAKGEVKAKGR